MLKRINVLIIASIIGLVALSVVQAYLINNTYKLRKDAFINESRKAISRIDDFSPQLDSITDIYQEYILRTLADYKINHLTKKEILKKIESKSDSLNQGYIKIYHEELDKRNIPYDLKFQKRIKSIILLDSIQNDTIFLSDTKTPKVHLIGDIFEEKDGHNVSNSLWLTDYTFNYDKNGETASVSYDLHFEIEDIMNIDGWEKIVFSRMKGLLILSFLIFIFVIALLYYSIKSLITQKKIADIKTDFVNNITHELKTPLATLSLATTMLKKESIKAQPEMVANTINTIERQNNRLQKLIDQVLNNSLGYNEITLTKEEVVASKYINTVLDDFLLSVEDKKVMVTRNITPSNQEVLIDKFYFTTALMNVLENAVKYNGNDIQINCVTTIKESLIVSITDNGIGISERNQQQLFEKFFRVGDTEVHNVKGLGLGLYYTNQIVKAHKGKIEVKSMAGKGTTFTITIPLI